MSKDKLSPRTRKILEELAERIIPSGGPDYPGAQDVEIIPRLIERVGAVPLGLAGLKLIAWLWEISPILFFRFKLLSSMSPSQQTQYLESWEKSRLMLRRYALFGLKAIFLGAFYLQPMVWEKIGYEPGKCYAQPEKGAEN